MIKVSIYGRRPEEVDTFEELLERQQWKHPFCKKIDTDYYMECVRNTYVGLHSFRHITKEDIDISSAEAFVRSMVGLGEAEIISE